MKIKKSKAKLVKYYFSIALLTLFTFACSLFSSPPIESTPTTSGEPPQEEIPAEIIPTETPAPVLPIGVLTVKDGVLSLFDREGYTLVQVNAAGLDYANESNVHILETFSQGDTNLPIVYFSFEQNNSLLLNNKGQISTLLSNPNFSGLVGAPGKAVIAYTTTEYLNDALVSNLYAANIQSLPTAAPVFSENNAEGWGLVALAVDVEDSQPVGVWYSKRPWGIGGDIVFDPRRTLFRLELRSGQNTQLLGVEANPSAISADKKWVAYTNDQGTGTGIGVMTIRNISTGENFTYPLQSAVNQRGAGAASFSPNNQYLAWMEGSGWQMAEEPNFHSVVRIGDFAGNVVAEFADAAFLETSGLSSIQRVEPVGWLDDNTLVVMARGEHWDDARLIMVELPSQTLSFLARGVFVGFVYP
ncbi:MAG: hypothetical protein DRI32_07100 [Chloroflexi bacterium]|nr:MAG: hypothetical protein DRI32_07100 [Chloroflexota bacterium]